MDLSMDAGVTRTWLLSTVLFSAVLFGGCASQPPANLKPPPLRGDFPQVYIEDVDVLAVSPEMEAFLQQYILNYSNLHTRMNLLMNSVSGNGVLGFEYDDALTLTSVGAFDSRAGNCIGFSNLLVAMAREAGIEAKYQEVLRRPQWYTREETVLLVKHINVVLSGAGYSYVMDVSGIRINPSARRQIVSDSYAKALYLNNLGADALIKNDLATAYAYMSKAIETEPLLTDSWVNIGVVLSRNEQLEDAARALRKALQINDNEYAAMSNLYEVYIAQEDFEAAAMLEDRVERYRQRNPYYLMQLSEEALLLGDDDEALRLIQRALKKKNNDHLLYFTLAQVQYQTGQTEAAQTSLSRARELAPVSMGEHYQRPLDELVAEAMAETRTRMAGE